MGVDLGDMYLPRGRACPGATATAQPTSASAAPVLLYQQLDQKAASMQQLHDVDNGEVVQIKLADLSSEVQIGQGLGDSLGHSLGLLPDAGDAGDAGDEGLDADLDADLDGDGVGATDLGPGGDSVSSSSVERGDKGEESKDMLPDLAEVTVEGSSHVTKTESAVVC